jgi:hypothetical protein
MSEREEAIVRSQAILMITRNNTKHYIIKKVMQRFLRCIKS